MMVPGVPAEEPKCYSILGRVVEARFLAKPCPASNRAGSFEPKAGVLAGDALVTNCAGAGALRGQQRSQKFISQRCAAEQAAICGNKGGGFANAGKGKVAMHRAPVGSESPSSIQIATFNSGSCRRDCG